MFTMQSQTQTVLGEEVAFTKVRLASGYSDKVETLWDYSIKSGATKGEFSTRFARKADALAHAKKTIRLFREESKK